MEPDGSPISVFSFLNNVRTHKPIKEIEKCRQSLQQDAGENTYSFSDGLKYAIMYGHAEYSEYLLKEHLEEALSDSICCPLLLLAVRLDMPEIVEQLCKYSRLKSNHKFYINKPGCSAMECGRTALHIAAENGNVKCTKLLLQYGADFNAKDDFGHNVATRILERLRPPHIHSRTILCLIELFKCKESISCDEIKSFNKILDTCGLNLNGLDPQWLNMSPGPFNLKQICRCTIRKRLMYPSLPEKLETFGLPSSLVQYLAMKENKSLDGSIKPK